MRGAIAFLVAIALLGLLAFGLRPVSDRHEQGKDLIAFLARSSDGPPLGTQAPTLLVETLDGKSLDNAGAKSLIVYISTLCSPSREQIASIERLVSTGRIPKDLQIYLISDEDPQVLRAFGLTLSLPLHHDPSGAMRAAFAFGPQTPASIVVDEHGTIRARWKGFVTESGQDLLPRILEELERDGF